MSPAEIIKEILYLVQHSTGVIPKAIDLQIVIYGLQAGFSPLEIKDALIMMIHEGSQKRKHNPILRSYDW